MSENPTSPGRSFSLRILLGVVTFLAVGFASMIYTETVWWMVLSSLSILLIMGIAVIAFVGTDQQRSQAAGFLACLVVYTILLLGSQFDEFDPSSGQLPTTLAIQPVYKAISTSEYYVIESGEVLPNYAPQATGSPYGEVGFRQFPNTIMFMRSYHLLLTLVSGVIGAMFANFIYARRNRQEA